jgi:hypothetical protein
MHLWRGRWCADTWRAYLDAGVNELAAIRHSTYSGRPLGSAEFMHTLGAAPTAPPRLAPRLAGAGGNILWIHNPACRAGLTSTMSPAAQFGAFNQPPLSSGSELRASWRAKVYT